MNNEDNKFIRMENNAGALINTDKSALDAYKTRKLQMSKMLGMEKRIDNIEALLQEILKRL